MIGFTLCHKVYNGRWALSMRAVWRRYLREWEGKDIGDLPSDDELTLRSKVVGWEGGRKMGAEECGFAPDEPGSVENSWSAGEPPLAPHSNQNIMCDQRRSDFGWATRRTTYISARLDLVFLSNLHARSHRISSALSSWKMRSRQSPRFHDACPASLAIYPPPIAPAAGIV